MNSKGQTLIEVLIALAVGVTVIVSTTTAVLSALSNSEYARNKSYAISDTQQAMDIIKSFNNNNYLIFKNLNGDYCFASTCKTLNSNIGDPCGPKSITCGQNVGSFVREVKITQNSGNCAYGGAPNETSLQVTVSWSDFKCSNTSNIFCHNETSQTCLSNFNIQPTP